MRLFLPFLVLFLAATAVASDAFPPESDVALATEQFWANVTFKPDSDVTVARFRAWFEEPPEKVFPLLIDTNNMPRVHGNYKAAAVLDHKTFEQIVAAQPTGAEDLAPYLASKVATGHGRRPGGRWTRYEYLNFDFPWPLANRWSVQSARVDESRAGEGIYRYDYEMSVGNFKTLKGYWEVVPVPGRQGWSEFRGSYESDAGIALPHALTRAGAKAGIKRDVDDNRRVLATKSASAP